MLKINFSISNYFQKNNFKNFYCWHKQLSKNKHFEFEIIRYSNVLFEFLLDINFTGRDHAGPELNLNLLGYGVNFRIYDSRHWDHINKKWEIYGEDS